MTHNFIEGNEIVNTEQPLEMNVWRSFWEKHDPDLVFAYETPKVVRIRDRQLGFLDLMLRVAVVAYVVGYVIIAEGGYLIFDEPIGVILADIQRCDPNLKPGCDTDTVNTSNLAYCSTSYTPSLGCAFMDEMSAVYPAGVGDPTFIVTRVNETRSVRNCNRTSTSCVGRVWEVQSSEAFYVAGIEDFTFASRGIWQFRLDHTVISPRFARAAGETSRHFKGNSFDLNGELVYTNGDVTKFPAGSATTFTLSELMVAAGVSLDEFTSILSGLEPAPYRFHGAILVVYVSYSNTYGSTSPSDIRYRMRVELLELVEYSSTHTVRLDDPDSMSRIDQIQNGVYVNFITTGEIGQLSFQAVLLNLASAIPLFAFASLIVGFLALHIHKLRALYYRAKFDVTLDFTDLRELLKKDPKLDLERVRVVAKPAMKRSHSKFSRHKRAKAEQAKCSDGEEQGTELVSRPTNESVGEVIVDEGRSEGKEKHKRHKHRKHRKESPGDEAV